MADLKLLSAGDDIKIWDVGTMNIVKQFNPHSHGLSCVRWSNNNHTIASTSTAGDKIALTSIKRLPNIVTESIAEGEKQTCLSFISNSRYLISGGKDKIVNVWDMKSKKLKKTFKEHTDAVTCVTVNYNDTHIASGSYSGDIILSNVVSGQSFSPLRAPKVQAIRGLQYSHFKKSLLGSVSDDGALNLWDASTRKLLKSFTDTHRSPATALCFSPVNDMLLASVGLDKRIVCYDAQGKSAVKVITADSPLTSIDLMTDGATFIVGTSRGQIKVYDLRMGETPKNVFTAHKLSVQCLTFQRPSNKNDTVSSRTSRTSTTQSRKVPTSTGIDSGNAESDSPESEQENINIDHRPTKPVVGTDDVFSPITSVFSPLSDNLANVAPVSNRHHVNSRIGASGDTPVGEVSGAVGGAPTIAQFQPFQVEFIKNMIEDAVEEARVSLHRDVVNLQVEMLRQFQIQMNEMKAELAKYSVNEALLAEIERLKEENRRLKAKY
ncbi:protein NEDD1-like [Glandiceps talaboti]